MTKNVTAKVDDCLNEGDKILENVTSRIGAAGDQDLWLEIRDHLDAAWALLKFMGDGSYATQQAEWIVDSGSVCVFEKRPDTYQRDLFDNT